jgi:chitin disaccharide deacetylase
VSALVVVNADDFGRTRGINRGVIRAHEEGIVTSASLMVRWPAAVEAACYAKERPELGVGLHLDLGEWRFEDDEWRAAYEVPAEDPVGAIAEQLETFRELVGREPTHLDSHQHVHLHEPVRSAYLEQGKQLGVPIRGMTPGVVYRGEFYGQTGEGEPWPEGIAVERLVELIRDAGPGVTEIACHPGFVDAELDSVYREEREREVYALCSAAARESGAAFGTFASLAVVRDQGGEVHHAR